MDFEQSLVGVWFRLWNCENANRQASNVDLLDSIQMQDQIHGLVIQHLSSVDITDTVYNSHTS